MENLAKKFRDNPDMTHIIAFGGGTVKCYQHTDQTIIDLVTRYYEGKYKKVCSIFDRSGNVIHKTKPETGKFNAFFNAYITAALWTDTDNNADPLDTNYGVESIAPVTLEKMKADCEKFLSENDNLLSQVYKRTDDYSSAGHDFWLTRNGHGTGFWDRGFGYIGNALTDRSVEYKESPLYVGDDNLIYQ